jgi:hypothetical protein
MSVILATKEEKCGMLCSHFAYSAVTSHHTLYSCQLPRSLGLVIPMRHRRTFKDWVAGAAIVEL